MSKIIVPRNVKPDFADVKYVKECRKTLKPLQLFTTIKRKTKQYLLLLNLKKKRERIHQNNISINN